MTHAFRCALGALLLLPLLAACGGSHANSSASSTSQNPDANQVEASVASFDIALGPPDRFMVGLTTGDGRFIGYGTVRVRVYPQGGKPGAWLTARFVPVAGTHPRVPMPATPQLVSAAEGRGVYETVAGFAKKGLWTADVDANVRGLGHSIASTTFDVALKHNVVGIGERAPATQNYTLTAHAGVPLTAVDSRAQGNRVPDPELHTTTVAAALAAHRPVVVVVSTPVYCTSRFCGPTTDMVDALAREQPFKNHADFVMIEVWQDYKSQQLSPAAVPWIVRSSGDGTEPWVFVVGGDGIVKARFGNVVTRDELVQALNQYAR